jgi:hypothetical protein
MRAPSERREAWTAAYKIWKGRWVGANGYYFNQIADGKIDAVALHKIK